MVVWPRAARFRFADPQVRTGGMASPAAVFLPEISLLSVERTAAAAAVVQSCRRIPWCTIGSPMRWGPLCAAAAPGSKSTLKLKRGRERKSTHLTRIPATVTPPPIDHDLQDSLEDVGAEYAENGVVTTFGNDDEAIDKAETDVAVAEMSHFGKLRVTGEDRLHFLHNQSTADFKSMKDGEGCYTVFVTPTARTIDLAAAWVMGSSVILFVSPSTRQALHARLNKYIFFADKVEIEDITEKTNFSSIIGPSSDNLLRQLGLESMIEKPFGTHAHYAVDGSPVTVGAGSGLAGKGYMLMLSTSNAGTVWQALLRAGAAPMGALAWERLRILQGRPAPGRELTDQYNVLEAGLWKAISLTKGCYIGQETVARLVTYDGIKQELWGIELNSAAVPGAVMTVDGQKVGQLTSCTRGRNNSRYFGLGYIRRKAGGAGLQVQVDGTTGLVVDIPFVTRSIR